MLDGAVLRTSLDRLSLVRCAAGSFPSRRHRLRVMHPAVTWHPLSCLCQERIQARSLGIYRGRENQTTICSITPRAPLHERHLPGTTKASTLLPGHPYPAPCAGFHDGRRLRLIPCSISQVLYILNRSHLLPVLTQASVFQGVCIDSNVSCDGSSQRPFRLIEREGRDHGNSDFANPPAFLLNSFPLSLGAMRDLPPH